MRRIAYLAVIVLVLSAQPFAGSAAAVQTYVGVDLYTLAPPPGYPVPNNSYAVNFAMGGQVVGATTNIPNPFGGDALLWNGPSGAVTVLSPSNLPHASATATNGVQQVGAGSPDSGPAYHALLWSGTAESAIDLSPTNLSGFQYSVADGISLSGTQQVGWGAGSATGGYQHAMLWYSTANSAVDLHPSTFLRSFAYATDGVRQVGSADNGDPFQHAMFWSGTADSAVDLHPAALGVFDNSSADGVFGGQQVGSGHISGTNRTYHALMWSGTAASAVDLHPPGVLGFDSSSAMGTNGINQVGYVFDSNDIGLSEAYLWSGSADSATNLDALLPFISQSSKAYSVDYQGNVFGTAFDLEGHQHAVEWVPTPEPRSSALLVFALFALLPRHRTFVAARCRQRL